MLVVSFFILMNIFLASKNVSSVPLVDGWAVWNQIMLLNFGEISFFDYIFNYFGAHPHSIIKLLAWLDYRITGGRQILTAIVSLFCIAVFGLFLASLFYSWSKKNLENSPYILTIGIIISLLSTTLADWQVMTLPFQAVLSVSRLFYVVLLWLLLRATAKRSEFQLVSLALIASIATTFHGSGLIFAAIWLMVSLVHFRRFRHIAISFLPIITWFAQSYFYKTGGELDSVDTLISKDGLINIGSAFLLYFTTPLSPFYEATNKALFYFAGLVMATFTIWLSLLGLLRLAKSRSRAFADKAEIDELSYAGILCFFVLLSALAASVLMAVRVGSFADSQIIITSRYIAYALIPYVFFVIFLAKLSQKTIKLKFALFACISLIGLMSAHPTLNHEKFHFVKTNLDKSIALISAGFSPLETDAMFIWPNAKDDWYWVNALPRTISYMRDEKIGPWHTLPLLGQSYTQNNHAIPIKNVTYVKLETSLDCSLKTFEGMLKKNTPLKYLDNGVLPVLNINGLVVGFAYQENSSNPSRVLGVVNLKVDPNLNELFVGLDEYKYTGESPVNSVVPYNLTDATWMNGIARNWPGFFVEDTDSNRELLAQGKTLKLNDNSYRSIEKQIIANGFLNIHTEAPLINTSNGFPEKIKIIDWCKSSQKY
ncbi:hypothetical protein QMA71_28265 [Pseudomonas otitidis]|uniref:hypothetical protein n=1 Tax=Metapseudomonas otitidis TaxID=319939 RepID=UPI0024ADBFDF|nr:hypothetical protein [Pseudomonas otitidis]MDI6529447.1 hypothetical protein [Pseudomonas otitidis]